MIPIQRLFLLRKKGLIARTILTAIFFLPTSQGKVVQASPNLPDGVEVLEDRRILHVRLKYFRPFGNIPWDIRIPAPRLFDLSADDIIKFWDHLYNAAYFVCSWQGNLQERQVNPASPGVCKIRT
jgi:hypothetical protein